MTTKQKSQEKLSNRIQLDDLYIATSPLDINNKIIIDIKDIKDFCFCPYYYYLKRENPNEKNIKELYNDSLHKTFYAYLLALQENRLERTLEFLKYQWGKEWIRYKNKKDIIASSTTGYIRVTKSAYIRDTYELLRKKGIEAIFKFDEIMLKDRQFPIIIGHKYQIEILPNIILTGTYEYVRELTVKDQKIIQIIKFFSQSNRFSSTNISRKFDIELIAMSYAFKETFNAKYFQVVAIDVDTKKTFINTYSDKEYNLLKETIKNVVICLQNNIKYISPDKQCYHCEYRNICMDKI